MKMKTNLLTPLDFELDADALGFVCLPNIINHKQGFTDSTHEQGAVRSQRRAE